MKNRMKRTGERIAKVMRNTGQRIFALVLACILFFCYVMEGYASSTTITISIEEYYESDTEDIVVTYIFSDESDGADLSSSYGSFYCAFYKRKDDGTLVPITDPSPSITRKKTELKAVIAIPKATLFTDGYGTYTIAAEPISQPAEAADQTIRIEYKEDSLELSIPDVTYKQSVTPTVTFNGEVKTDGYTIVYKKESDADFTLSDVENADAGNYEAKATYNAKDATYSFKINKAEGSGTLSISDIEVGGTLVPVVSSTTNTDGELIEYKKSEEDPIAYSTKKPTAIGEYTARAVFNETTNYMAYTSNEVSFKINAKPGTATFSIDDTKYNETLSYMYNSTTNGNENVTIYYKKKDSADAYVTTEPTEVGTYTAKAVFPAKGDYAQVEIEDDFSILKADGVATLTVTVNADGSITLNPVSSTNGTENVTYQYKVKGAADSTYSTAQPTETGEYTAKATFAATTNYNEATATADFELTTLAGTASFQIDDIVYGQTITPVYSSTTNGTDNVTITYKAKGAADSTYTTAKPTNAGTYTAKAVFGAKGLYGEIVLTDDFTIEKAEGSGSLTVTVNADGSLTKTPVSSTNGTDNVTYQYKVKGAADSTYSTTQPTAIGEYTAKATFAETANYKEATATANFEITVLEGTATFQVADIVYGQTIKPVYTSGTNGTNHVTITYKVKDAADSTYTTAKPTNAGDYTAKAVFAAKDPYGEIVLTDDFTIEKAEGKGSLKITVKADGSLSKTPASSTNGTENVTYQYKVKGAADSTYSSVQPTEAGEYTAKATFAATTNYKEITATADFEIPEVKKKTGSGSIKISDITYGEGTIVAKLTSKTNGTENVIIEYKRKGAADSTYSTIVPTQVGKYTARATFAETDTYNQVIAVTDFEIKEQKTEEQKPAVTTSSLRNGSAQLTIHDISYGQGSISAYITSKTNGSDNAIVLYKKQGEADSSFSETVPTIPGKYTAKAIIPATDNYKEAVTFTNFEIKKGKSIVTVKAEDIYFGETVEPVLTTNREETAAVFEYKEKNASDASYSSKVPTKVGEYTVRVAYPENAYYLQAEDTADFKISYMPAPIFSFDGTKGDNKFYTSSVKVMPPKGYLISTEQNGDYSDMLLLTEDENYETVYFKNKLTGATSAATALGEYEIDETKPEFADAPLQKKIFADSLNFSLEDKNLMSVLVNGEEMEVNGSQVDFEMAAEGGYKEYYIQATDRAGNVSELHFILYSPWLQNRIVPANENILLEKKTEYFLSNDGSWKVDGDDTVYSGGGSFYIKNDGNYLFQKK